MAGADTDANTARAAATKQQIINTQIKPRPVADDKVPFAGEGVDGKAGRGSGNNASSRTASATPSTTQSRTAVQTATAPAPTTDAARSVQTRRTTTAATEPAVRSDAARGTRSVADEISERVPVSARSASTSPRRGDTGTGRQSVAASGGRAIVSRTGEYTTSNFDVRSSSHRSARARAAVDEDAPVSNSAVDSIMKDAALTSCAARYEECMDQFCDVVDDNQKRCSCSGNLQNFKDAEDQLKKANQNLNTVAQNIRYVGLSAEEIYALFNETEAEQAMRGVNDISQTRSLLEEIEKIIAGATDDLNSKGAQKLGGGVNMFDLALDGNAMDMDALFGTGSANNMSNLRGTSLKNAAAKKCQNIVNDCKKEGVKADQLTANYDLKIDKSCLEYEKTLTKMNDSVTNNIRSANTMLQKARLAVLESQNEYDFKGCVQMIDNCILEDTSCGKNYIKCLDPTRNFLDETGKVILGGNLPMIKYAFSKCSASTDSSLCSKICITSTGASCTEGVNGCTCNSTYTDMKSMVDDGSNKVANLLMQKIGNDPKAGGMCIDVVKSCRRLTYKDGAYNPANEVVREYKLRAVSQMKSAAAKVVSDYANKCLTDVGTCYSNQMTNISAWTSVYAGVSAENVKNVMLGACRTVSYTCSSAIFEADIVSCPRPPVWPETASVPSTTQEDKCIDSLSKLFYNSLLCGPNMEYKQVTDRYSTDSPKKKEYKCVCQFGYESVGGVCRLCPNGADAAVNMEAGSDYILYGETKCKPTP
ncbi:MAG: hypothetical protein LBB23_00710 [Rickettsiales bacterium]|nr:hypothetical protein [Rickettsiales bacterium]